jgi:hexosaminidase
MVKFVRILAISASLLGYHTGAGVHALWPLPTSLQSGSTPLKLSPSFTIHNIPNAPSDLQAAVTQTHSYLFNDKLERLVVGRGAGDNTTHAKSLSSLTLSLPKGVKAQSISDEAVVYVEDRDEAYELSVPADGSGATLSANSTLGLYRGLTTFAQMWYTYNGVIYTIEAPFQIEDKPTYVSAVYTSLVGNDSDCLYNGNG